MKYIKDDFPNYLPTVMFRGTPCKSGLQIKNLDISIQKLSKLL